MRAVGWGGVGGGRGHVRWGREGFFLDKAGWLAAGLVGSLGRQGMCNARERGAAPWQFRPRPSHVPRSCPRTFVRPLCVPFVVCACHCVRARRWFPPWSPMPCCCRLPPLEPSHPWPPRRPPLQQQRPPVPRWPPVGRAPPLPPPRGRPWPPWCWGRCALSQEQSTGGWVVEHGVRLAASHFDV